MSELGLLLVREELVVVAKPAGISVIPGRNPDGAPCVRALLEAQLKRKVWVVHRLDRDTSGALMFALTEGMHRTLSMAFEAGEVSKTYRALVEGRLDAPRRIDLALESARKGRMRPVREGELGKASVTDVRPLEVFAATTYVEAIPLTGRTHQIRVHLRSIGHPLVVDHQYGSAAPFEGLTRTPLHAATLSWKDVNVEAPLPADFEGALNAQRAGRTG